MSWDRLGSSYDRVADRYEARFADELEGKAADRHLLETFAAAAGDPVVDVGCGPGQIGAYLRQRGRIVVGVDLSFQMARLAGRRLCAPVVADMRALPFTGRLGGLVAYYSLIHLRRTDLGGALDEFHRVLRPGGRLLFTVHEGKDEVHVEAFLGEPVPFSATFFELDELVAATLGAGFEITRAERRDPHPSDELRTIRLYVEAIHRA